MWDFNRTNFDDYRNRLDHMNLADQINDDVNDSCDNLTNSILLAAIYSTWKYKCYFPGQNILAVSSGYISPRSTWII